MDNLNIIHNSEIDGLRKHFILSKIMTRKNITIFSFAILVCIVAACFAYQKFEKYLPTPTNALAFPPELSDLQIQKNSHRNADRQYSGT